MHEEEYDNGVDPDKHTDWVNEPKLSTLKLDYSDGKIEHDVQIKKISKWLDLLYIKNTAKVKKVYGRSNIQPKLIRKQAEWRYAALAEPFLTVEDMFHTDPVTFEDKAIAYQNGLILNNQFNTKIDKVKFIDELIRNCVNEGTGIIKSGWDYQEEQIPVEIPNIVQVPLETLEELQQAQIQGAPPFKEVIDGYTEGTETNVLKNHPSLEICDFNRVIVDPTCKGDLSKANFIVHVFETSVVELKSSGKKYKNLDRIKLEDAQDSESRENYEKDIAFRFNDERKKIWAFEYWGYHDIKGDGSQLPFVCTWIGETVIKMMESPFPHKKLPFDFIPYLPVKDSIYGEPDAELLEDNQKVIGATTRGMVDLLGRSANAQRVTLKGALDPTNKRRRDKGLDYEINGQDHPEKITYMHKFPEIPNSAMTMLQLQNNEADSISGIKGFSDGINSATLGDSVGGIKSVMSATAKREFGILARIVNGLKGVARKMIAMNSEWLDEQEVVRLTNEEYVQVDRKDLGGLYDIRLKISTPEADDKKASELAFMLQTVGPSSDPGEVRVIRAEIARLRKMPELAKRIEDYEPKPDPMAQEIQQLEVQKLKMEIAKLESEAMENRSGGELDMAKARNMDSDTDIKNLDFVEQEGGTKHERDVDKIKSQSRAQGEVKILESQLNKGSK